MTDKGADKHLRIFFNQVMIGVGIAAFLVHAIFLYIFSYCAVRELVYFNVASLLLFVAVTVLSLRKWTATAFALTGFEVILHAITATYYIGWDSGFHFYTILLIPVVLFGPRSFWFTKLPLVVVTLVTYMYMMFQFKFNTAPVYALSYVVTSGLHMANTAISLLFLCFLCGIYNLVVHQSARRMYQLANTDALSGLRNRRSILETADIELQKQLSKGNFRPEFHVLICDIDYFKKVNDTHGHDAGDAVIRAVADVLKTNATRSDYCARWGGEEFLIIVPNKKRQDALDIAEAIREQVEALVINHEELALRATMTLGVCSMRRKETLADAIDRADKALYNGKQSGRNRVVFSNE